MNFDLSSFLPYRLSVLSNRISRQLARVYQRDSDLDIPQWRVLAILANHDHLSATQVAQAASMDKVRISRTVAKLRAKGLIEQEGCQHDGRTRRYRLTAAGRKLYDGLLPRVLRCEKELFSGLDERDIRHLHRLIDKITKKLPP